MQIQFETSSEEEEEERETEGMTNSGLVDVEDLGKLMELAKVCNCIQYLKLHIKNQPFGVHISPEINLI